MAASESERVYKFCSTEGLTLSEKIDLELKTRTPFNQMDPLEILGETNLMFLTAKETSKDVKGTDIQEAFSSARVLVTGATGYLGKAIVEKLLRSMPKLDHLYLIMRPKRNKTVSERMNFLLENKLFSRVNIEMPNFRSKITVLEGDCSVPGLGLSAADRQMLVDNLNYIFHSAATTKFNETIKKAVGINVVGTLEMVKLAREIKELKAFVYISTAFCNCTQAIIEEKFYASPAKYQDIIKLVETTADEELEGRARSILGKWPNSYLFTKVLGEQVVLEEGKGLPMAVMRPSVVYPTYREPVRGWIDTVDGMNGLPLLGGLGIIQVLPFDKDNIFDIIPVDVVANASIAASWKTATVKEDCIQVYNCVSQEQNPITIGRVISELFHYGRQVPVEQALWYPFVILTNLSFYRLLAFFLHTVRGYLLDLIVPKQKGLPRLTKIYRVLSELLEQMYAIPFEKIKIDDQQTQKLWKSLSAEDKDLFFFDIQMIKWTQLFRTAVLGYRYYLINEDMSTLRRGRRRAFQYYVAHTIIKYSLLLLGAYVSYRLTKLLFVYPIQYVLN